VNTDDDYRVAKLTWLEIQILFVPIQDTTEQTLGKVVQDSVVSRVLDSSSMRLCLAVASDLEATASSPGMLPTAKV
jgi:hypothetical protein